MAVGSKALMFDALRDWMRESTPQERIEMIKVVTEGYCVFCGEAHRNADCLHQSLDKLK
jgi:hypothetical protein